MTITISGTSRRLHVAGSIRGLKPLPSDFEGTAIVNGEISSPDCDIYKDRDLVGHGTNFMDGRGWYVWAI